MTEWRGGYREHSLMLTLLFSDHFSALEQCELVCLWPRKSNEESELSSIELNIC